MTIARLVLLVLGLVGVLLAPARADDHDMQAHMEAMRKAVYPGPMHEEMLAMVGEWTTHTKMWMQPGTTPTESHGTASFETIYDGRFLLEESTGTMMGQPYTAMKIYGYHNGEERYQALWTYSLSTAMLFMEGELQDDGAVVFEGAYVNDLGQATQMKVMARSIDENTMVEKVFGHDGLGNEEGVLTETTYTRVVPSR